MIELTATIRPHIFHNNKVANMPPGETPYIEPVAIQLAPWVRDIEVYPNSKVDKNDFDIIVIYSNGKSEPLSTSQFEIVPSKIPATTDSTYDLYAVYKIDDEITLTSDTFTANVNSSLPEGYSKYLINGDFSYPSNLPFSEPSYTWMQIDPDDGKLRQDPGTKAFDTVSNFDPELFGWKSTDPFGVELQLDRTVMNVYAEICATQRNSAIYQDIATIPGTIYVWELDHTSIVSMAIDSMEVRIGPPGQEVAQEATRITVNGYGNDELGPVGTTISTDRSGLNENRGNHTGFCHSGGWETYTGTYTIPEGQTLTRFTFASINSYRPVSGNCIDNIKFSVLCDIEYIDSVTEEVLKTDRVLSGTKPAFSPIPQHENYEYIGLSKSTITKSGRVYLLYREIEGN